MRYYVIRFVSEAHTLQDDTTCAGQTISSGELVVKTQYISCIQEKTNWYWDQKKQQQVIIFPTWTIVHPCIGVVELKDVHDIPKSICNRNQTKKALGKHLICLTDSDYNDKLEDI